MKCLRLGFVLSLICVGLTPMGAANAQTNEAIDHWNTNAVLAALQSLKAGDIQAVTSEGRSVVTAKTRGGLNVGVYAKSCDPTPTPTGVEAICHGLEAIISFDPGPKVHPAVALCGARRRRRAGQSARRIGQPVRHRRDDRPDTLARGRQTVVKAP